VHVGSHGATVLDKTGMVLGVVAGQRYEVSAELALQPGDVLFLRTDGVDECMSPERELFGEARLQQSLHRARGGTADQILDALSADLAAHSRGQEYEDDIAMLAVKLT
jgi:sigma-B regulation protein RsbU (phosphoserine phosphatase)